MPGIAQLAAGSKVSEWKLLISTVTTKRQDRLVALEGDKTADEGLSLDQNADDVICLEVLRQG